MKEPLKNLLKEHYESHSLDQEQLAALRARFEAPPASSSSRRALVVGVAATVLIALVALVFRFNDKPYSIDKVASEISYNHNKRMALEVSADSVEELRMKLEKLDFTLIASSQLSTDQWQLVGARYCSIHGKIAAQMRYLNRKNGQYYTLYQTAFPPELNTLEREKSVYKDGNLVRVWHEKDLLLGLAGPE